MLDKVDSHLIDSMERGLLATVLFDNKTFPRIKENIFSNPLHAKIYHAMKELYDSHLPITDEILYAKLGSSFEQTLLNISGTSPIDYIEPVCDSLIEHNFKVFMVNQLKKIAINELSVHERAIELEALLKRSKDFNCQEVLNIANFTSVQEASPKFYLENILPLQENEVNIISAAGGSGKSYMALYIALEFISKYANKKCFLWLSEDEVGVSKKRASSLCRIYSNLVISNRISVVGKENQVFHFLDKNLNINKKFIQMKQQLEHYDLIVLDPLIAFYGADENSNSDARYFMSLLNKWCTDENKTLILIHHHSKQLANNKGTARGASAFIDACRMHYIIEKIENDTKSRKVVIDKTNHYTGNKNEFVIKLFDTDVKERTHHYYQNDRFDRYEFIEVDEL